MKDLFNSEQLEALRHHFPNISKTMRNEKTEMAVEIYCRQNDMEFMEKIRDIGGVEDVTLIQYNGEYHG